MAYSGSFIRRAWDLSLHYLDDFLLLGPRDSPACTEALCLFLVLCKQLGVPVAAEKTEGPATALTFLRFEIGTVNFQLCLPQDNVQALMENLQIGGPPAPLRLGLLNDAALVIQPGRTFLFSLIDASTTIRVLYHHVHMQAEA